MSVKRKEMTPIEWVFQRNILSLDFSPKHHQGTERLHFQSLSTWDWVMWVSVERNNNDEMKTVKNFILCSSYTWLICNASARYRTPSLRISLNPKSSLVSVCEEWKSSLTSTSELFSHLIDFQGISERLNTGFTHIIDLKSQCLQCLWTEQKEWSSNDNTWGLSSHAIHFQGISKMLDTSVTDLSEVHPWCGQCLPSGNVFTQFSHSTRADLTRLIFKASPRNKAPVWSILFSSRSNVSSVCQVKVGLSEREREREKEKRSAFTWLTFNASLRCRTPSIPTLFLDNPRLINVYEG